MNLAGKLQLSITCSSLVLLCFVGFMLSYVAADVRSLKLQMGDLKTEVLKLHLDMLQNSADARQPLGPSGAGANK